MQVVVVVELEAVSELQGGSGLAGLGQRHGAVQLTTGEPVSAPSSP
jgi:hypothetical protein